MTVTIIFIVLATFVGVLLKRRSKDRCLNGFSSYMITLANTAGKNFWGKLHVENSGLELLYETPHKDSDGHSETGYILI